MIDFYIGSYAKFHSHLYGCSLHNLPAAAVTIDPTFVKLACEHAGRRGCAYLRPYHQRQHALEWFREDHRDHCRSQLYLVPCRIQVSHKCCQPLKTIVRLCRATITQHRLVRKLLCHRKILTQKLSINSIRERIKKLQTGLLSEPWLPGLFTFVLSTLYKQAFKSGNWTDYNQEVGNPAHIALVTAIQSIILIIICFIYGSLEDSVPLEKMFMTGMFFLLQSLILGFLGIFFVTDNLSLIIIGAMQQ